MFLTRLWHTTHRKTKYRLLESVTWHVSVFVITCISNDVYFSSCHKVRIRLRAACHVTTTCCRALRVPEQTGDGVWRAEHQRVCGLPWLPARHEGQRPDPVRGHWRRGGEVHEEENLQMGLRLKDQGSRSSRPLRSLRPWRPIIQMLDFGEWRSTVAQHFRIKMGTFLLWICRVL